MPAGRINSIQSLGTLDGPGVRTVVFMQGCPLRCKCCHNPETWEFSAGEQVQPEEVFSKIKRYRSYYGKTGGVTVSGGEPLVQAEFVKELFSLCKAEGIHTCLDTSGAVRSRKIPELLKVTDLCLLDVKMDDPERYREFCGGEMESVMEMLEQLEKAGVPVWIRRVIIPGTNDSAGSILKLKELLRPYKCVKKCELLPFRKLCVSKYSQLGLEFPLVDLPEAVPEKVRQLEELLR